MARFEAIFFYETAPIPYFWGQKDCHTFWGKIVLNENFNRFYLKRPRNCFSVKHVFGPNSFMKQPPHILAPNGLFGIFRGKIVSVKMFARSSYRALKIVFLIGSFRYRILLRNCRVTNFLGNRLFGAFQGKIVPNVNFASFGLKHHRNRFSKGRVSRQNCFERKLR